MARVGKKPSLLVLNRVTVEGAAFQGMADMSMTQVRKQGGEIARAVRAASPVGPRRKRRSSASRKYGPLKSNKTKFTTRGKRQKTFHAKTGKHRWSYKVERAVIVVPFYGFFQDKGWNAPTGSRANRPKRSHKAGASVQRPGVFIEGSGYVTNTIKNFVR